jgi:hypothetical protein
MRKLFTSLLLVGIVLFVGCTQKNVVSNNGGLPTDDDVAASPTQRKCETMEVLQDKITADPNLQQRMQDIENFTQQLMSSPQQATLVNGVIQIPVVVNVVYRTAAENVSDAQIRSQIDVLNEDFSTSNADYNNTPSAFTGVRSGDVGVRFVLDQIIRKQTTKRSWATDDAIKSTSRGGISPTSPTTKLNVWVCTLSGGVLGYAQFPGGGATTDGVVILNTGFGRTGTARAPFNKGRTATHEVGHWMNLRHIWGDTNCGNDLVGDTPLHTNSNFGCPAFPTRSTCTGKPIMMTMNYMDYTDDACMFMFSAGQRGRMLAVFAVGGPRASFR